MAIQHRVTRRPARAAAPDRVIDARSPAHSWLDLLLEVLLVALLAFMPLALGVIDPWSEQIVLLALGVIAAIFTLRLAIGRRRFVWTWSLLPIGLFASVASLQLLPLPASALALLSPDAASMWGSVPATAGGPATLSLYPHATLRSLQLLLVPVVLFIVALHLAEDSRRLLRVLTAISIIGLLVAVLALAQIATGTTDIYWRFPVPSGRATGGPFVNRGHFAQFINLSLGASIGLLLAMLARGAAGSRWFWMLAAAIVVQVVAVPLSLSRGGVVALGVAMLVAAVLMARYGRQGARAPIIAAIMLAAVVVAVYFGYDAIHGRFAGPDALGGRDRMLRDMTALMARYPVLGTGFGSFQVVFPMVDTAATGLVATHAENEYAQVLVEVGGVGLAIVVAFVVMTLVRLLRVVRSPHPALSAAAVGIAFGLVAAIVHSFSDFGQHMPAVAGLSAVLCGLIWCTRSTDTARQGAAEPSPPSRRTPAVAGVAVMVGLTAAAFASAISLNDARLADGHWQRVAALEQALATDAWNSGNEDDFAALITQAQAASNLQPRNVQYRYGLNALRWRSVGRFYAEGSEPHTRFARRIVPELHDTRRLCPTFGPPVSLAGQIEAFVLEEPAGAEHIRLGYKLAPTDAAACFAAGRLAVRDADWPLSLSAFGRAIKIDPRRTASIVSIYKDLSDRADLAIELVRDQPEQLLQIATELQRQPDPDTDNPPAKPELARQARDLATAALAKRSADGKASAHDLALLADLLEEKQDHDGAILALRQALSKDMTQHEWRLRIARILHRTGRHADALKEVEIVLRQQPDDADAGKLAEELRRTLGIASPD